MNDFDTSPKQTLKLEPRASGPTRVMTNSAEKLKLYMVTDHQIDQIVGHKVSLEGNLLGLAPGICIGSATGSVGALINFAMNKTLSVEGFVQNIFFFSALSVSLTVFVVFWSKRRVFKDLIDTIRERPVRD